MQRMIHPFTYGRIASAMPLIRVMRGTVEQRSYACYTIGVSLADEIGETLVDGPSSVATIADAVDHSTGSIRTTLHRHKDRFTKLPDGRWNVELDWVPPPPRNGPTRAAKAEASRRRYEAAREGCEICGSRRAPGGFVQDHDHITGENRGTLCSQCNLGLGCFLDQPDFLEAAAAYVQRYEEGSMVAITRGEDDG